MNSLHAFILAWLGQWSDTTPAPAPTALLADSTLVTVDTTVRTVDEG